MPDRCDNDGNQERREHGQWKDDDPPCLPHMTYQERLYNVEQDHEERHKQEVQEEPADHISREVP